MNRDVPGFPVSSRPTTLVDAIRAHVRRRPDAPACTFLADGEAESGELTYRQLDLRVRAVAAHLRTVAGRGERALLLYLPGLEFVTAFLACLAAGVVAVPTVPPRSRRGGGERDRLHALAADAGPTVVLTESALLDRVRSGSGKLRVLATDQVPSADADGWRPPELSADDPAFLQYTSGSTAAPKGVVVTHGNLVHNEETIKLVCAHDERSVMVSWLPPYHDMGLIAGILQPLYCGGRGVLFSPVAFLQRPVRWLDAVTRYRGTTSGGPNFAYDLCVRKITAEERRRLDLSSWRVAFNGAEPVRADTVERFARVFARCGFDRRASYPCYGLAEATLLVTGGELTAEPLVEWFDPDALEEHRVAPVSGMRERVLISCGRPWLDQQLRIVDPESRRPCPPDRVGEIWVAGASVAQGYWGRPQETARDFAARLAGDEEIGAFLRTGDLGFLWEGELFVTGRLKDLIIIRGRNHYPQDLELTAAGAHPLLRPGGGAAFSIEAEREERLVVVHELRRGGDHDADAVAAAVRRAVTEEHEVHVHEVVLIRAGALPKTTSGKVRHRACRVAWLAGKLPVIAGGRAEPAPAPAAPVLHRDQLLALPAAERPAPVLEFLRGRLAAVAGSEAQRIDPEQPLTALGLDSLRAVELSTEVEERLGAGPSQARLLEGATLREVAVELVAALASGAARPALEPAAAAEDHPLSRGQRALWFLDELHPGTSAYLLSGALRIHGTLDAGALRRALERVVERHPALRTTIRTVAGEPRQVVRDTVAVELVEDPGTPLAELARRPFDFERGPLWRIVVERRSAAEQVLMLTIHHLISDLGSIAVLLAELEAFYREEIGGPAAEPPALRASYTDYVHWQEEVLGSARGEELVGFWAKQLDGELPVLDLPTDRPRPAVPTMEGALSSLRLDGGLVTAVGELGQRHGATPFMTLAAVLQILLHRYTAQDEVLVGAPTTGRGTAELRGMIGYFVNPVVLRGELGDDPTFASYLERTRRTVLAAFAHQDYPFPLLAERLQPERDTARAPVFQAMLVFQQARHPGLAAASLGEEGARLELFDLPCETLRLPCRDSQLDLTLYAAPWDDGLGLALEYAAELFDAATARRLLAHLRVLLEGAVADPGRRVSELPLLADAERAQTLHEWTDTGTTGAPACLHELVTAQVRRRPTAAAVVCGRSGRKLTYRQLERRSAAVAARLRRLGVTAEVRVGVCLPRTPELVVALLGVLRAGGTYVPIDPEYPAERQAFMLADSAARVLITSREAAPGVAGDAELVLLDELSWRAPAGATRGVRVDPQNLSHLIYTSGSTGVPKGVAIRHAAAVAMVRWSLGRYRAHELRAVLFSTSVCFDISVYEIFVPLACGGTVIVAEDALALPSLGAGDAVTLINTVPSAMTELVRRQALPPGVRTVNLAGEPLKRELVDAVYASGTVERVYNLYGPSEDTTYTTWAQVPRSGKVSIGRTLDGTRAYVLDRHRRPLPPGVPGELYLAGEGLARGYLGRPALTAARFVPDGFSRRPGRRLYRTGDLVRYLPDGEIDFLGRIDHQVKVRGFRIELGEIESALLVHESVRECVVVTRDDPERGTVLVAYVAGVFLWPQLDANADWERPLGRCPSSVHRTGDDPQRQELQDHLRRRLPEVMVPPAFVMLDRLPLLPNGKVNRRALPAPEWTAAGRGYVAPRGPVEELLAGIWSAVLGVDRVGAHDRFFDLGGHSLLATRVLSRVRKTFGLELPVRTLFEAPELAALAARIEARGEGRRRLPPLEPADRGDSLPLSFAQQRLWFLDQLEPGSPYYNVAAAGRLRGPLAAAPWRRALAEIVRRHQALRTRFGVRDGEPVQRISEPAELALPSVDLTALPEPARERELAALERAEARRPFDLARGPLLRTGLVKLAPDDHAVWVTMHHIVSDGWSLGVFFRELTVLYEAFAAGRPSPLPELAVQYPDFACWQRRVLSAEVLASELEYWRRKLDGAPALTELPADRPRPAVQSLRGATCGLHLPAELVAALEELGRRRGATLFMTLLSAFQVLLCRWSGQRDAVVGSPVAHRNRVEIEPLIGFFVNTLVLRTELDPEPSFSELLARVRLEVLDAWAHQDVSFEKLVEELAPERHLAYTPLFQVVLALQNAPWEVPRFPGLTFESRAVDTGTAKFDLTLLLEERGGALAGTLEYATALFDASTVRRLLGHFRTLLAAVASGPERPWAALELMSAAERVQLLLEWTDTRRPYPREATVHELFEAQAARTPEAVAVVFEDEQLSYRELNARANRLAHHLRSLGVGPEVPVALFMERSAEMVVAIVAVVKAGGFYLPLDTGYPAERLAFMLDDVGAEVLLAREHLLAALPEHRARVVCVDRQWAEITRHRDHSFELRGTAENLCYVMHTSGSTGRPKGVAVTHRGVVRLVRETDFADLGAGEVFLQLAPISFDAATLEIWAPLTNGGRLVVFPAHPPSLEELGAEVERRRVSTLWLTAGLFHQMAESQLPRLSSLRQLLAGGDVLSVPHVRRVLRELPPLRLINGYGPTENTTFTCCQRLAPADADRPSVPIGRPIAQTGLVLVDSRCRPVPIGVPGELWITGDGLARGYFARPALSAERFVPDPVGEGRAYRTGDLARALPDGRIEYLGRLDAQVKVRGFRIELGEIEVALRAHPAVRDAVVAVDGEGAGDKRLVAYVVASGKLPVAAELRELLRARLPEYMVPAAFMTLDELPLTPNGKVDRRALPAPEWEGERADYAAPRTAAEEILAGLYGSVLGVGEVGAGDGFFDLGGYSLLATRLVSRIRRAFGVELGLHKLFESPSVAALAAEIERARSGDRVAAPPLVPIADAGERPPSFAQERLWLLDQLEPGSAFYNIPIAVELRGRLDERAFSAAIGEIVRRHQALRTTFPAAGGRPRVVISPPAVTVRRLDLDALPAARRPAELRRLARAEARRPFDLARGPLLRLLLARLGRDEHQLLLTLHHIAGDGWSLGVLLRELAALYDAYTRGLASPLPRLAVQYADFAAWQRQWLEGRVLEEQLTYWRQRLEGAPALVELPTDRPRPAVQSYRGSVLPVALEAPLGKLGRDHDATLFMILLAAFQTLLARYGGGDEVVVGSPVAGRNRIEIEDLIGFFVNTLVLRTHLGGNPRFAELLARVRAVALDALAHQELPFDKLVEELHPQRHAATAPFFQVLFVLQNAPFEALALPGLEWTPWVPETGTAKFDLTLSLEQVDGRLVGWLEYATDLFDRTTVRRLIGHFQTLLDAIAAAPERRLSALPLLSVVECHQLEAEWNVTPASCCDPPVHERIAARAAEQPEAVAVVCGRERLSYGELNARGDALARHLRALGVGRGVRVGLCLEGSPEYMVGLVAVLKAGGVYVPLDPAYPRERLDYLLGDAGISVLLTGKGKGKGKGWQGQADEDVGRQGDRRVIPITAATGKACPCRRPTSESAQLPAVGLDDLAYVIYTSGSTGTPKGSGVYHRGVANLVRWYAGEYGLSARDRFLIISSVSFDLTQKNLLTPLVLGGQLHFFAARHFDVDVVRRTVRESQITLVNCTPTALYAVLEGGSAQQPLSSLRVALLGGEPIAVERLERGAARSGVRAEMVNMYGPTECTDISSACRLVPLGRFLNAPVPIGRPPSNVGMWVLDRFLEPCPVGVEGDLWVGGESVGIGYFNSGRMTAEKFVPDPFGHAGGRIYSTGDRGRFLADGNLEFLGRVDHQVKLRGFRVELGEIEAVLQQHPAVREAVALIRDQRLVAYVAGDPAAPAELRRYLRGKLPEYMVPAAVVGLDAFPLTPNRKVDRAALDRRALPEPEWDAADYVAPRTAVEEIVAGLFAGVLGAAGPVGAEDDFFDLGAHSLLATQLVSRMREALGIELPLRKLFESPTVAALAAEVERLRRGERATPPPLVPLPRDGELRPSFAQERLWFLDQLEPESAFYNIPIALHLRGALDQAALAAALGEIVRRHQVLRMSFPAAGGKPRVVISPPDAMIVPRIDLDALAASRRPAELRRLAREEARRPFDLARGPLLRARLVRRHRGEHELLLIMHHIVGDGWSLGVLLRELAALYRRSPLPALPVQYADYAHWQRQWLQGRVLEEHLDTWRRQLEGAPAVVELPLDRPRPAVQSFRGALVPVDLPPPLLSALRRLSRKREATLFMTLLAAFQALLGRYRGQDDLVVGSVVANRGLLALEELIGFFVNTLVMRADLSGNPRFAKLLERLRAVSLEALAHQDLPFEKLVEELRPERDGATTPFFQVLFVLQNLPFGPVALPDLEWTAWVPETGTAKFDLTLTIDESEHGPAGWVEYRTDLFDATTVRRLSGHYRTLLAGIVAAPERKLSELPLLTPVEHHQLHAEWNVPVGACADPPVHERIAARAALEPEVVAVVCGSARLSYGELDERSGHLARSLRALGVGRGTRVGLCLEGSPEYMVGLVAVLKAGAAYVPLDPNYPRERLDYLLGDAGISVLLTGKEKENEQHKGWQGQADEDLGRQGDRLVVPITAATGKACPCRRPTSRSPQLPAVGLDDLIYVIYTSGSTGTPKGSGVYHRGAANLVRWYADEYGITARDRFLILSSVSFDLTQKNLLTPLAVGGQLHFYAADHFDVEVIRRTVRESQITLVNCTPTALYAILEGGSEDEALPSLRVALLGGEAIAAERLLRGAERSGAGAEMVNMYGPTECTDISTACRLLPLGRFVTAPVPIGRPPTNVRTWVLDGFGGPCPVGVEGDLWVGGESVGSGYLRNSRMTAEKFVPDPFAEDPGRRIYRTGDRGRVLSDGNLEFLGRVDHQVKLRGFRVELGEIEAVLAEHPAVRAAVAVVRAERLVAYVVGTAEAASLRAFLRGKLPEYMIPSAVVGLDALPLTPNRKVDRRALPEPEWEAVDELASRAPRTAVEEIIAGLFASLLGAACPRVGADDNFFALGAHSLLAAQLISRIRQSFAVELPLRKVFESPTVAGLAAEIEGARRGARESAPAPRPRPSGVEPPLSFAQERLWFLDQLEPESAFYNIPIALHLRGALDQATLAAALGEIVRRHQVLRTTFPAAGGKPRVLVSPPAMMVPRIDLDALAASRRPAELRRLAREEARRPFDLARGPLLRARLVRRHRGEHALFLTMHHIVGDGWSLGVLLRELAALYRRSPLPALPVQYADYAHWQRQWLQGRVLEEHLDYWRHQLEDASAVVELPLDRPRPAVQGFRGALVPVDLPVTLLSDLRQLSRDREATLFMTLLAAFQALLGRYRGQDDVVVGSVVAGRGMLAFESLVGFFVNTLVMRADLSGNPRFAKLLERLRAVSLEALAHQDLPFEKLVEELKPERDTAATPFFQVLFVFQNLPFATVALPGVEWTPWVPETGTAKFDLTLGIDESGHGPAGWVEYRTDLFDATTVRRLSGHYRTLLAGIVAAPERKLSDLPLLTSVEHHQLHAEWNEPVCACADPPVHERIAARAALEPEAVAVVCGSVRLSYGELEERSDRLARSLRSLGVGRGTRVGLCLEGSPEYMVGLVAVLKAGAAYVPLDPNYPRERLDYLLGDAGISVLLTGKEKGKEQQEGWQGQADEDLGRQGDRHVIPITAATGKACPCRRPTSRSAELPAVGLDELIYVIYTSGSTGTPKGSGVYHRGVANLVRWYADEYGITARDRLLIVSSVSFDLTQKDLLTPLVLGGQLHFYAAEHFDVEVIRRTVRESQITLVNCTPTAFYAVLEGGMEDEALSSLRVAILGGEVIVAERLLRGAERSGIGAEMVNTYGPTECTDTTNACRLVPLERFVTVPVPIGRPSANVHTWVLDRFLEPCPVGVEADLWVGGEGVGVGYLRKPPFDGPSSDNGPEAGPSQRLRPTAASEKPKMTAEKFVPDPFAHQPGRRIYRTGDRGRVLSDGNLEFLGRVDHQVKLRGFRVELGEIEAVLTEHPGVREAVAVVRDQRLVAYVVGTAEPASLRGFLRGKLPEYMIPSAVVGLDAFPLTPNRKVDRRALMHRDLPAAALAAEFVAPRTPTEEILAGIWTEVLSPQAHSVGVNDDFFALGGHSLLATMVVSRLREAFGIELLVREIFTSPRLGALAARIDALRLAHRPELPPLEPVAREEAVALSFAQERLWFLDQMDPGKPTYNVCDGMLLAGDFDLARCHGALGAIVRRHQALRTTFRYQDGGPLQVVAPYRRPPLPLIDLAALGPGAEAEARRLAAAAARRPFDLARGPLLRVGLLRLGHGTHAFVVNMHHIVSDAWSMAVFVRELSSLAFASGEPLPPLPVQYPDFALWQRRWLGQGSAVIERELGWWREQLAAAPEVLELPADRPRPSVLSGRGTRLAFGLRPAATAHLGALAREHGATPFMVLLAGLAALLYRYTGQEDVLVGSPVANRNLREIEGLIGFFVNTLVLRSRPTPELRFGELVRQVREMTLGALDHQNVPFERLVEELQPQRDPSRSPLFQVALAQQEVPIPAADLGQLRIRPLAIDNGTTKFDLTLVVTPQDEGASGIAEYYRDVFDATTIRRLLGHWQVLLATVTAAQRLGEIALHSAAERHHLLSEWNDTAGARPRQCIPELFAAQARRTPEAVALVGADEWWSYAELDRRAEALAWHLRRRGVGPEVIVAVSLERSPELVIAILAVVKAGGAYLPLDPTLPSERYRTLLRASRAILVLTRSDTVADPGVEVIHLDRLPAASGPCPRPALRPENLAYVMVTSGSTGVPKGVAVPHRGVVRLVRETNYLRLGTGDVFLHLAPIAFDASTLEVWGPLLNGGRLVVYPSGRTDPRELGPALVRYRITTLWLTAGLYHLMIDERREDLAGVRHLLAGGDVLSPEHVRRMVAGEGERVLINGYGPTENTTFTCCHPMRRLADVGSPVSIGRPIAGTRVFILDRRLRPVPLGVLGELSIAGDGLARGYLGRPELTAAAFVPADDGGLLYRTGDLVRHRGDGTIEFVGRIDRQVKLRGFRIEPGEIEAVLGAHPAVEKVAVLACEFGPQDRRLVAFLVAAGEERPELEDELRELARARLPEYMVPAHMSWLEALPLTVNGKLDREALIERALEEPGIRRGAGEYVAPRDQVERTLAALWSQLLGVEEVSIRDSFFDLGGHSLLAVRLMGEIRGRFGIDLPLATLFRESTVERLAQVVRGGAGPRLELPLVEIQPGTTAKPPLYCLHAGGGNVVAYAELARSLGAEYPVYGFQARGLLAGEDAPRRGVAEMADAYLEELAAARPAGPYVLAGHCFGGLVAWEMAVRLEREGREVALVALLDTEVCPADRDHVPEGGELVIHELRGMIELGPEELAGLEPDAQLAVAVEKLQRAEMAPADYSIEDLRRQLSVVQGCRYAWREYEPPVYPAGGSARLVLLRAREQLGEHGVPTAVGWDAVAGDRLEILVVPGSHTTLIRPPHVKELARSLRRLLRQVPRR